MGNFEKSCKLASEWVDSMGGLEAVRHDYGSDLSGLMQALEDAGLLMPDMQIIHTPEELEALAREDVDAVVLASEAGAARSVKSLCMMYRLKVEWGLPAVVIASGKQVRAAREAMEKDNE